MSCLPTKRVAIGVRVCRVSKKRRGLNVHWSWSLRKKPDYRGAGDERKERGAHSRKAKRGEVFVYIVFDFCFAF